MRRGLTSCILVLVAGSLVAPAPARATITFNQIGDDLFVVSHRVKIIGSRGQAVDLAYTKAASLCLAAGFSHFEILDEISEAGQSDDAANASLRVRFSFEGGDDRIECERNADPKYVEQAREKLDKRGYRPPARTTEPASPTDDSPADDSAAAGSAAAGVDPSAPAGDDCSLEQVAAMARAGLADEQIERACAGD